MNIYAKDKKGYNREERNLENIETNKNNYKKLKNKQIENRVTLDRMIDYIMEGNLLNVFGI